MEGRYYKENMWWVSPYNFIETVRSEFNLPQKVLIHDATLRDGEQTPGVVFQKDDKIRIAQKLDEVGVDRIMFSADHPYGSMAKARAFLDQLPVSTADREKIAHGNAERLLKL